MSSGTVALLNVTIVLQRTLSQVMYSIGRKACDVLENQTFSVFTTDLIGRHFDAFNPIGLSLLFQGL